MRATFCKDLVLWSFCVCAMRSCVEAAAKLVRNTRYYDILGIETSATEHELKKAYRQLALKWHPDKHASEPEEERKEAEDRFRELSLAYDTLSDPERRRIYDQLGEEGMKKRGSSGFGEGSSGFRGDFDASKLFHYFFGTDFRSGFRRGSSHASDAGSSEDNEKMEESVNPRRLFQDLEGDVQVLQKFSLVQALLDKAGFGDPAKFVFILYKEHNANTQEMEIPFARISQVYKGVVSFFAIECSQAGSPCRLVNPKVKQFPCLTYYGDGRRLSYWDLNGRLAKSVTEQGVRNWLEGVVPDHSKASRGHSEL